MSAKRAIKNTFYKFLSDDLTVNPKYLEPYKIYLQKNKGRYFESPEEAQKKYSEIENKKKLTYDDIGFLLNVSKSSISRWSCSDGISQPSAENLFIMSEAFCLPVDYMLGLTTSANSDVNIEVRALKKYGFEAAAVETLYNLEKAAHEYSKTDDGSIEEYYEKMIFALNALIKEPADAFYHLPRILVDLGYYFEDPDCRNGQYFFDDNAYKKFFDCLIKDGVNSSAEMLKDAIVQFKGVCKEVPFEVQKTQLLSSISANIDHYRKKMMFSDIIDDSEEDDELI